MILQFVVGFLCDKHHTIKRYAFITLIMTAIFAAILYALTEGSFWVYLSLAILFIGSFKVCYGVFDSWCMELSEETKNNYGFARAFGSIGWAIGSYLSSWIVEKFGYAFNGYACIAFSILLILYCLHVDDAQKQAEQKVNLKDVSVLIKNKKYVYIVLAFFAICIMQVALDTTVVDKLIACNGTEKDVGLYWSLTAIVELPLFFIGNRLVDKFGNIANVLAVVITYGIRFVLYGLATNATQVLWISTLQFITFPLFQIVSKNMVDEESPDNLKSTGQQLAMAVYSAFSALVVPIMAGLIEDAFDINVAMYAISSSTIIALIFIGLYLREKRKN